MKLILSPHLPGSSQEEMDLMFRKPHPQERYPTRAELEAARQKEVQNIIARREMRRQNSYYRTVSPQESVFHSKSIEVSRSPAVRFPRTHLDEIADAEAEGERSFVEEAEEEHTGHLGQHTESEDYTNDMGKRLEAEEYADEMSEDMEAEEYTNNLSENMANRASLVAEVRPEDEDMREESIQFQESVRTYASAQSAQSKTLIQSIAPVEFVAPTPRVTGAFIETPAPFRQYQAEPSVSKSLERSRSESPEAPLRTIPKSVQPQTQEAPLTTTSKSLSHSSADSPLPTPFERPTVINTAVTYSAEEEVRQLEIAAGLSDSPRDDTLERFAAVKEETTASPTTKDPFESIFFDEEGLPLSSEQRAQKLEMIYYERMNKRLANHSSSLRQTTRGIGRITDRLTTYPDTSLSEVSIKADEIVVPEVAHQAHQGSIVQINKPSGPAKIKFSIDMDSDRVEVDFKFKINLAALLWRNAGQASDEKQRSWRNLTWMGIFCLFVLIGIAYCCADYGASMIFSRPAYSRTNSWSYDDPEFPFVMVTKTQRILSAVFRELVGGGDTGGRGGGCLMNRTISMDEIVH